jgi:hypothetical protein
MPRIGISLQRTAGRKEGKKEPDLHIPSNFQIDTVGVNGNTIIARSSDDAPSKSSSPGPITSHLPGKHRYFSHVNR